MFIGVKNNIRSISPISYILVRSIMAFSSETDLILKTPDHLFKMKTTIESMNKYHQIEILKILSKNLCKLNENKSGVYVNLSFVPDETVRELNEYINYTREQEDSIITMEYQKEEFKNAFFSEKEDKDNVTVSYNSINK
jgi:hypothetical protein